MTERAGATTGCFHGGAFFEAIGERLHDVERRHSIVNADVLDAWFPPAPAVLAALGDALEWLARTSPPVSGAGLQQVIAEVRGIPSASVLPGAGSSDLIFLALRHWLSPTSRALLLDPCYGEYAHVLERVIGCRVDRLPLSRSNAWVPDPSALTEALSRGYDLVVIVNPNNPTGHYIDARKVREWMAAAPAQTRFWIDEAYLEYVEGSESLEAFAAASRNVFVSKSMSKVYGLSGMRVAYLVGSSSALEGLRRITPPWAVSLPAQLAGIRALQSPDYYRARHRETSALRAALERSLREIPGIVQTTGAANFVLCHLDEDGPDAATVVARCQGAGVYLRDVGSMGTCMGSHVFRTAVKNERDNATILGALACALDLGLDGVRTDVPLARACARSGNQRIVPRTTGTAVRHDDGGSEQS